MKKFVAVCIVAVLLLATVCMTGCFDDPVTELENPPVTELEKPIVINADLTLENPEGLEFDSRYVLKMESDVLQAAFDVPGMTESWMVVYGLGTDYVYQYSVYVYTDAEALTESLSLLASAAGTYETNNATMWSWYDSNALAAHKLYFPSLEEFLGLYYNQGYVDAVID